MADDFGSRLIPTTPAPPPPVVDVRSDEVRIRLRPPLDPAARRGGVHGLDEEVMRALAVTDEYRRWRAIADQIDDAAKRIDAAETQLKRLDARRTLAQTDPPPDVLKVLDQIDAERTTAQAELAAARSDRERLESLAPPLWAAARAKLEDLTKLPLVRRSAEVREQATAAREVLERAAAAAATGLAAVAAAHADAAAASEAFGAEFALAKSSIVTQALGQQPDGVRTESGSFGTRWVVAGAAPDPAEPINIAVGLPR